MLQECQHIHLWFLLQEGLHSHSSTTQAEVEVPKPEDLIKPGSDIPWAHWENTLVLASPHLL